MEDKYTDVMSEISVKNSLINHLERENIKLKERVNDYSRLNKTSNDSLDRLRLKIKTLKDELNKARCGGINQ
tara:strand:+ start:726 stop:941 length:216 start_codon:yes stop_codon:yes gene_type:complete